jgi:hypothetical protein
MSDIHIVTGMDAIVNPDNVKPGIDLKELERKMISGGLIKQKTRDPQDRFNEELQDAAKKLGISFGEVTQKPSLRNDVIADSTRVESMRNKYQEKVASPPPPDHSDYTEKANPYARSNYDSYKSDVYSEQKSDVYSEQKSDFSYKSEPSYRSESYPSQNTSELLSRSQEQTRREHIDSIMGTDSSITYSLEKEKKEDQKSAMLAEIDSLISSLTEEDVNLERIPKVDQASTYEQVEAVLRMLRHKNDHIRYSSFFEEFMLFGAYGLEELFDGKRMWFGRYQPNAEGWHNNVNVKLRRMRHDTGQLVSGAMQDYNIGPGARILLELIPNLFLYTKMKSQQQQQPDIFTDEEMAQANARISNSTF